MTTPQAARAARRMVQIRLIGSGVTLANAGSNVSVTVPDGANAVYIGAPCRITFDGNASSATTGLRVTDAACLTEPVLLPQGALLNIFGETTATYIQFCLVS